MCSEEGCEVWSKIVKLSKTCKDEMRMGRPQRGHEWHAPELESGAVVAWIF
jgi:hypothetical protein